MMTEISLNVLDITENSVKAGASLIRITVEASTAKDILSITVEDNGCGMSPEQLAKVTDPFFTTRTTRKVGLGLSVLKLAAEQTGGTLTITSRHESEYPETHGTVPNRVWEQLSPLPMFSQASTGCPWVTWCPQCIN